MNRQYLKFIWWYGCAIAYFWLFAAIALHAWRHPFLNWDMVAYMGVAESFSTGDPVKIHDAAMADAESVYDPAAYNDLTQSDPLTDTAGAFYQQLPLYSVKPLYTGGIWLLHRLGLAMPEATWALSIIGALGIGAVCYFFIPSGLDAGIWWLIVRLFCVCEPYPMGMMARLSTPDTLCIALSIAAWCLWIYRRSFTGFAACFLLAQLARPDALMQSALLALYFTFLAAPPYRLKRSQGIGFIIVAALLYAVVAHLAGNYGWRTLFYYKFIGKLGHPADAHISFGWEQYIGITHYGVMRMLHNGWVQFMLMASCLATACCYYARPENGRLFIGILWLAWLSLAARFLLFPAWDEERYYYPYYFVMLYALAETIPACIKLLQYVRIGTRTMAS